MTMTPSPSSAVEAVEPMHSAVELARLTAEVEQLRAECRRLETAQVDAADPRVSHIWESALEAATDRNALAEYQTLAEHFGIPTDTYRYLARVNVHVARVEIELTGIDPRLAWLNFINEDYDERAEILRKAGLILPPSSTFTLNRDSITLIDSEGQQ